MLSPEVAISRLSLKWLASNSLHLPMQTAQLFHTILSKHPPMSYLCYCVGRPSPSLQEAELCLGACPAGEELTDDDVRLFVQRCTETVQQMDAAVAKGYHLLARFLTEIMLVCLPS